MIADDILHLRPSPMPAWPWGLFHCDGRAFKKFKSRDAALGWLKRHGYGEWNDCEHTTLLMADTS